MNFQNTNNRLKIVLSVGDESGIGPEITLKALCSNEIPENIDFILVGSKKNLQKTYEELRSLGIENLANFFWNKLIKNQHFLESHLNLELLKLFQGQFQTHLQHLLRF